MSPPGDIWIGFKELLHQDKQLRKYDIYEKYLFIPFCTLSHNSGQDKKNNGGN